LNNFRKWHDADDTIDVFGAERWLFGSNFPVEKLWTSYADLITAYRSAIEPLGEHVARPALHDTAARIYRLN
jgi:predicted TIM-barrel fold metal-dependent hydrolase